MFVFCAPNFLPTTSITDFRVDTALQLYWWQGETVHFEHRYKQKIIKSYHHHNGNEHGLKWITHLLHSIVYLQKVINNLYNRPNSKLLIYMIKNPLPENQFPTSGTKFALHPKWLKALCYLQFWSSLSSFNVSPVLYVILHSSPQFILTTADATNYVTKCIKTLIHFCKLKYHFG